VNPSESNQTERDGNASDALLVRLGRNDPGGNRLLFRGNEKRFSSFAGAHSSSLAQSIFTDSIGAECALRFSGAASFRVGECVFLRFTIALHADKAARVENEILGDG
jgi:hypothetical protein